MVLCIFRVKTMGSEAWYPHELMLRYPRFPNFAFPASNVQVRWYFGVLVSPTKQMCNWVLHCYNMCIAVVLRSAVVETSCRVLFALPPLTWEFPFDESHSMCDSFSKQIFGLQSLDHIHYIVPQVHANASLSVSCIVCTRDCDLLTWLILPVVICLSQRLSHACLSISFYTVKLRMAH